MKRSRWHPFRGLKYEASEREYWAEDDHRAGLRTTTWCGFWLIAFFGRLRDLVWRHPYNVFDVGNK